MNKTIYDFSALEFSGNKRSLRDFEGKVVLIVNTASKCFFNKQFETLESLYRKYKQLGFEVLAFPSNDFRKQEPLTGRTLETYCRIAKQVSFPVFKRIHVRGEFTDPLYQYLSNSNINGKVDSVPLWNFHKYLVNRKGEVVDYFYSLTSPMSKKVHNRIEELLSLKV
ncbi:UNVERIFIED_CONTAM: Glutathione peroxidase [Trichonephila clavipes]|uniref:Glutathione peroxidase n=1 Tax=Sphingobacterium tenebrionis TaxID=3111775 RepID=A0ABU8I584_9SPHI|nr:MULTISPECIES: glutathione peroxidase [unclassified Sphingobacterium]QBR11360.1 glutathione peroxidase [Sphingobacterium sp. CZ-2]